MIDRWARALRTVFIAPRSPTRYALAALAVMLGSCSRSRHAEEAGVVGATDALVGRAHPDLAIMYTSDLRGRDAPEHGAGELPGGLARRATLVDIARGAAPAVIQVDAGDFLPHASDAPALGAAGLEKRAKRIFGAYARMGVDVITPGERELAFGVERLRAWCKEANVTAVASNLEDAAGEPLFARDHVLTRAGRTIGIFAVLDIADPPPHDAGQTWKVADAALAARRAVSTLRERGAQLVVGLVHTDGGTERLANLLGADGEVDIAILAHAKPGTPPVARIGRTQVLYAAGGPPSIGRADVAWPAANSAPQVRAELLPLSRHVREQLGVGLLVAVDREDVQRDQEAFLHPKKLPKGVAPAPVYERWEYTGVAGCALCHKEEATQWKTTAHAHAVATLQQEAREKDAECLGCHLTGYLQPGGSQRLAIATAQFAEVGCEACHGASAPHVRSLDKKKGTSRSVDRTVCLGCHTPDQAAFDYDGALKRVLGPGHGAP